MNIAEIMASPDPLGAFMAEKKAEMKRATELLAMQALADYERDHLLSRGAPVGKA
jgi:hypothetical protein